QDGQPVTGASVTFFRGTGTTVELLATTGSTGFFNITDAPDGTFTLCIYADGFVDFCRPGVQITGGSFAIDPVAVTSTPPSGSYRIILTWGTTPGDLDAHLTGPDGGSGRFHVYYGNRNAGGATLDHDDTSANGPETMSINVPATGMYRFSVHNFSTSTAAGAAGMAASPTRVEVYSSAGLIKSYTAPSGGSGNTWRVFEMTVNGGSAAFNDNGGASLGYVTAASPTDTGTFLTGGGDAPAEEKRPSI
ncbi:MAG TPA: carboxypeptidase regulatory-like domain-containing protein, partial [Rhodothermales bacterium]|nr:carboxypeptidase regulatory-like domain-containing protein [Rhodothermales bacterium]